MSFKEKCFGNWKRGTGSVLSMLLLVVLVFSICGGWRLLKPSTREAIADVAKKPAEAIADIGNKAEESSELRKEREQAEKSRKELEELRKRAQYQAESQRCQAELEALKAAIASGRAWSRSHECGKSAAADKSVFSD